MENNENEFQNASENQNIPSSDPFAETISKGQSDNPFATVENNNGYAQAANTGAYVEPMQQQGSQAFAITGMVLGIISLVCCCFGWLSTVIAIAGLVFSIISIVKKQPGKGMAIAGIICSSLSIIIMLALFIIGAVIGATLSPSDLRDLEKFAEELQNMSY